MQPIRVILLAASGLLLFAACAEPQRHLPPGGAYHPDLQLPRPLRAATQAALAPLPLGCIHPRGWLRRQLQIQAEGLGGNIESIWPDLGPNSGWKGGSGEAWERGPYYLDGLVPLAFELEDPVLLERMQAWIDWILASQRPDGSLGPNRPQDWWPDMVLLKVLQQYAEASGDPRVGPVLSKYFDYLRSQLPARRLDAWRKEQRYDEQRLGAEDLVGRSDRWQYYRWMEMVHGLLWMRRHGGEEWLLALAKDLRAQGYDWEEHFRRFRFKEKTKRDQVYLANHGVNNAMGLKAPALDWLVSARPSGAKMAKQAFDVLNKFHGQPNGAFSADEQLAGLSPSQGTELCTVIEEMFSLETIYWVHGEAWAAEAVERLAYNALPAAFDEAMWTHQYDQQANQVLVSQVPRAWSNNGERANLFGLEPEWGCCTANFHQGWPKFMGSLWMATGDGGLQALSYAPCQVHVRLPGGQDLKIDVSGAYPFSGEVQLTLELDRPATFPLRLPIPSWASHTTLKWPQGSRPARSGAIEELAREWKNGDTVLLRFDLTARSRAWGDGLIVEHGPLLLAMDIPYEAHAKGQNPWSDKELIPTEAWNWGLQLKPGTALPEPAAIQLSDATNVFDRRQTPLRLKTRARRIGNWTMEANSAGQIPNVPLPEGESREVDLIPYGAAKLRVSVFPRDR